MDLISYIAIKRSIIISSQHRHWVPLIFGAFSEAPSELKMVAGRPVAVELPLICFGALQGCFNIYVPIEVTGMFCVIGEDNICQEHQIEGEFEEETKLL